MKGNFTPAVFARLAPKVISVDPGKELTPFFDASLQWTAEGKQLQLNIYDYSGNYQSYEDIKPGKYLLTAEYALEQSPDPTKPFWTGTAKTAPVAFEILEAPDTSKPVSVEGLEFTAIAPAHVAAPATGGKADVDIGLRIVNLSDSKPITVCTLRRDPAAPGRGGRQGIAAGTSRRKDLPKVTPPVTLGPGESWKWRPEASLPGPTTAPR